MPPVSKRRNKKMAAPRASPNPSTFAQALDTQMRCHGDTAATLHAAIQRPGEKFKQATIRQWLCGNMRPSWKTSMAVVTRIEARYQLPPGYFGRFLPVATDTIVRRILKQKMNGAQRRVLRWHLPDDFLARPNRDQEQIVSWVRENVFAEFSSYAQYMKKASLHPYAIQFAALDRKRIGDRRHEDKSGVTGSPPDAPPRLMKEVEALVRFKTSKLTATGFRRYYIWNNTTAEIKVRRLGLLFGALSADPASQIAGLGLKRSKLTLGLLVFPNLWDWFLLWREKRRGFFTLDEANLTTDILAFTRPVIGWLRQNPQLGRAITPIPHLISRTDIARAQRDWEETCDVAYQHALSRLRDIKLSMAAHRDNFQPILPVLEADSPLGEYRKIADEVLKRMPDQKEFPLEAAEAARAFLLLRFGMHLGIRQKNLRELLYCPKNDKHRTEHELRRLLRGELRWNGRRKAWEIFIPYQAFKNHYSTFFDRKPFRLELPDVGSLYPMIETYLARHRAILLAH